MYPIKTTGLLKEIMRNYFQGMEQKDKHSGIAWCTSVGPAELLRSFGFEVYFPENHGALIGATRTAEKYIPEAVKLGYSGHICSYTTSDIGSFISGETPLQKHYGIKSIPEPDIIVYNTNQCREVEDWFNFYAKHFNCPIAGIYPPRYIDKVSKEDVKLVISNFKKIIPLCEKVSAKKFDIDNFKEVLKLSKEATLLWQEVLKTAKNSPAPLTFFDGIIHMAPIVVLRGTEIAKEYYNTLLKELKDNIRNNIAAVKNEKYRIFWDGMPIWGRIRRLSELFKENNAAIVASTYCNSWIFDDFDENNPFESSALAYTKIFINRSEKAKEKILMQWVNEYEIDGIIFHDTKTCFNNSNARFGMPLRIQEKYNIPTLIIEGDLCDLRFFSEAQSVTKIETFIEQIEEKK